MRQLLDNKNLWTNPGMVWKFGHGMSNKHTDAQNTYEAVTKKKLLLFPQKAV